MKNQGATSRLGKESFVGKNLYEYPSGRREVFNGVSNE
jgi:hypothetical protein